MRVAAGAVARKILTARLGNAAVVRAALVQVGPHKIDRDRWDWEEVDRNPFFCPDADAAARGPTIWTTCGRSSSAGAMVEVVADGVPAGLGEPIYGKLDSDLASAMMSINAVKGVEIGDGFDLAAQPGEEAADEMRIEGGRPVFLSNRAGGVLGGISTGQPVVARFAVKPTSSILTPRRS